MPLNEGLRRVLSGFKFSPQASRSPSNTEDQGLGPEYQWIAQTLWDVQTDDPPLSQSYRGPGQTLHGVDANASSHARAHSLASSPLLNIKSAPIVPRHTSELQQMPTTAANLDLKQITYQDLARDKQALEQRISNFQLILDQVKLDLLQTTKEKHALRQQIHRLDEENQRVKDQLQDAKRELQSLQSEVKTHAKMKEDPQSANKEKKRLQADLADTKRRLEATTSELRDIMTRFQDLTNKHKALDKSFRDSRLENRNLEIKLAEALAQVTSLTEEKNQAEERMKKYHAFAQAKTSALVQVQAQLASLQQEKETWRGRMYTMIHKVFVSERRIRMLHHAARTLETQKMKGDSGHRIRRGNNLKPDISYSAEIVEAIITLNKAILDAAVNFTPLFLESGSHTWSGNLERAKVVLGEWVTSRMQQAGWNRPWLLQSVIQIFLVDWCRAIIEAWYPKQQSFAELFITGLMSHKPSSKGTVKFQAIQATSNGLDSSPDIGTWATQILEDLLEVVPVPNMKNKYREDILLPKLANLAQLSYDLRQALAEGDICGNIQLLVPPSDIQFQPNSMKAVNLNLEIRKTAPTDLGDIAGSTSIGLRNISIRKSDAGASSIHHEIILAPTVALARDMLQKNPFKEARVSVKKDIQGKVDAMVEMELSL